MKMNLKTAKRLRKETAGPLHVNKLVWASYAERQYKQVHRSEPVINEKTGRPFLTRDTAEPIMQDNTYSQPQPIRLANGCPRKAYLRAKQLWKAGVAA